MAHTYTEINWPAPVAPIAFGQLLFEGTIGKSLEAILMGEDNVEKAMLDINEEITRLLQTIG